MSRSLYPLNALRAFEAAARHLSFVKAADELHVTPAAISHQVKGLEEFLGTPLFRRLPRGLRLTDRGQDFFPTLRESFSQLDKAVDRARSPTADGALTISVAPIFAAKWLLPRLEHFNAAHKGIDLRISTSLAVVDFRRDDFDAGIRVGNGKYPGLRSVELFEESVTPLASPHLLREGQPLRRPDDLRHYTLLHDDIGGMAKPARGWSHWLDESGAKGVDPAPGPHFSHPDHTLQAAIDGAGIALGCQNMAAADLEAGRLIAPFELALPTGDSFYLVYPEGTGNRPKLAAFGEWLLAEVVAMAPSTAL